MITPTDPVRPPTDLVLLAGLNNTPAIWDEVAAALATLQPSTRLHRPHLPPLDATETIAAQLLDDLPPRFACVGFSFGGYVALAMLEAAPQRFTGFALVCSSTRAESQASAALRRRAMEIAAGGGYETMVARAFPNTVHPSRLEDPALLARRATMVAGYGAERFVAHGKACLDRPDRTALLRRFDGPKLIVATGDDKVVPPDLVGAIAHEVPDARFVTVADCGHLLPLERPLALATELAAWLNGPRAD
jgi:pimeloyl-ACP methyl ester carboxylesterase